VSFDSPVSSSGRAGKELTVQDSLPDPGTGVEDRVDRIALQEVLMCLPEMEAELIRLRYFKNLTQSQTGQLLGMSQVQVSRLEKKVLAKLRKEMTQE
jgi:RNA polymerase sporulation-specific sigma factor